MGAGTKKAPASSGKTIEGQSNPGGNPEKNNSETNHQEGTTDMSIIADTTDTVQSANSTSHERPRIFHTVKRYGDGGPDDSMRALCGAWWPVSQTIYGSTAAAASRPVRPCIPCREIQAIFEEAGK